MTLTLAASGVVLAQGGKDSRRIPVEEIPEKEDPSRRRGARGEATRGIGVQAALSTSLYDAFGVILVVRALRFDHLCRAQAFSRPPPVTIRTSVPALVVISSAKSFYRAPARRGALRTRDRSRRVSANSVIPVAEFLTLRYM